MSTTSEISESTSALVDAGRDHSRTNETRRVYACHCAQWTAWAEAHGVDPFPAAPEDIAAYLWERTESGISISTLRLARATISAVHRDAGRPDPTAGEGVKRVLSEASRMAARRHRRTAALTRDCLAQIQTTAAIPRIGPTGRRETVGQAEMRGKVDVALILVMRDGMLRRSEAAAVTWADIECSEDGSGRLTVGKSKTGPSGQRAQYLGRATVAALNNIKPADPHFAGLVFDLSANQISRRIKATAAAAGLDGEFSGDSPRVGMALDLAVAGCEMSTIVTAGPAVAQYYGATSCPK